MLALKVVVMPAALCGKAQVGGPWGFAGALTRLYQLKGSGLSLSTWYVAMRCCTPVKVGAMGGGIPPPTGAQAARLRYWK